MQTLTRRLCSFSRCPYAVLGVPREANISEIKIAFRREALKHHPDRLGADAHGDRFSELAVAYSTLTRSDDRGGRQITHEEAAGILSGVSDCRELVRELVREMVSRSWRPMACAAAVCAPVSLFRRMPPPFTQTHSDRHTCMQLDLLHGRENINGDTNPYEEAVAMSSMQAVSSKQSEAMAYWLDRLQAQSHGRPSSSATGGPSFQ